MSPAHPARRLPLPVQKRIPLPRPCLQGSPHLRREARQFIPRQMCLQRLHIQLPLHHRHRHRHPQQPTLTSGTRAGDGSSRYTTSEGGQRTMERGFTKRKMAAAPWPVGVGPATQTAPADRPTSIFHSSSRMDVLSVLSSPLEAQSSVAKATPCFLRRPLSRPRFPVSRWSHQGSG